LQQTSGTTVEFNHDRDEEYEIVRYDAPDKPVWYNITAYVRGYYIAGQPYNHTYHSIELNQTRKEPAEGDFIFKILNATYYGLDLQGQIVYSTPAAFNESKWYFRYSNNTSFDETVYVAYTNLTIHVFDRAYGEVNETFPLIAWVSRRDVAVSNVTASPREVYQGEDVNITVIAENQGATNETFDIIVYRNDTAIGNQTVSNLAPGNQTTLTFIWDTTGVPRGDYVIKAEASVVPYERDTDDNTKIDDTVKVKLADAGCPYVSTWNGSDYVVDNNLIPAAEYSNGTDVTDYYLLQQPLVRDDGKYSLLIWESDKHSFLDKAQLLAVDHETDVKVAVSPEGEILTYRDATPTTKAFNKAGENVSDLLKASDGQSYQGYAGDYIVLDFEGADIQDGAKLVIRSDVPAWPKSPVHIQIPNSSGNWYTIATIYTRLFWATDIVDLAQHLPDANGELKVRISFTSNDKIDFIGLDTSKQGEFETHHASMASAVHSNGTDVKEALTQSDNLYAELLPGEQVTLKFTLPQSTEDIRDFIIITEGHHMFDDYVSFLSCRSCI
jgi:hypothetical protein